MNAPTPETATEKKILDLVADGTDRTTALLSALDVSEGHLQKVLKDMTDRGLLDRHRDGGRYVYEVPDHGDEGEDTDGDAGGDEAGVMPADRPYLPEDDPDYLKRPDESGFDSMKVEDPGEYFASDGELRELLALMDSEDEDLRPFALRAMIGGPTGCGKTTLVETLAATIDATFITVQMSEDMSDKDLLGKPSFAGGDTKFVDGPIPKALMASNHGEVVLLLDEYNRAPANAKNALFSALDHRGEVRLDGPRGGEVVSGVPDNIHVFATVNEGTEYHGTHRLDHAEESRFTYRTDVDYLASDPSDSEGIDREAELLVENSDLHPELARSMVEAVAEVRREATDATNTTIDVGIPTRSVVDGWAPVAERFHAADLDNALMRAARKTILSFYQGDEDAYGEALGILESHLQDAPLDTDEWDTFAADEIVTCADCSYEEPKPDAEDRGVLGMAECPECHSSNINVRAR